MDDKQIELLLEHLPHWYNPGEIDEIMDSDRPALAVAAELGIWDFAFFCRFFLSEFFVDRPAEIHWDVFDDIQQALTEEVEGEIKLAESLPRGFGKSTIVCVGLPLWCIVGESDLSKRGPKRSPLRHYILLIKDSFDQAKLELAAVKDQLENNELLRLAYGDFRGPIWAKAEMVTSNSVRIDAVGTGQKLRGRRHGAHRPDLIVGDDLENDKTVKSATQRQEVKYWWSAAVEKAGDPKRVVYINIGTLLHYDCLQAWMLTRPGVQGRKYKSLLSDAERQDLWDEWRLLVTNLEDEDRARTARQFYLDNKVEMDRGTEVAWPERFPYYVLNLMRLGEKGASGKAIKTFGPEMQNEPISDEDRMFRRFYYWHWEQERGHNYLVPETAGQRFHINECRLIGACDPSLGEAHDGSFSAIIDLLVAPSGRIFVAHSGIDRIHPDRIIDQIRLRAEYWASINKFYTAFGIETVQFQKLFASSAGQRLLAAGIRLPIVEVHSAHNKKARIDSLQPDIHNGYLLLMREPHAEIPEQQELLYDQLWEYPMGDFLDGPDALEMGRSIAAGNVGYSRTSTPGVTTAHAAPVPAAMAETMTANPFT